MTTSMPISTAASLAQHIIGNCCKTDSIGTIFSLKIGFHDEILKALAQICEVPNVEITEDTKVRIIAAIRRESLTEGV